MASTTEPVPTAANLQEEWKEKLGDLVISSSAIETTLEEFGKGSFSQSAVVVKLNGTKCISKTVQTSLFAQNEFRKLFIDGCLQLGRLRHPNIVQLIGVQLKDPGAPPAVIYEHLHFNLQNCLLKYPSIPKTDKYSILGDVIRGLSYLHSKQMIHGSLNARNVLLTSSLKAKISDPVRFGAQVSETPPSMAGDVLGFGDLILHVLLQQAPAHIGEEGTEVERRKQYFDSLAEKHQPLKELAIKCLDDNPIGRPTSTSLAQDLEKMVPLCEFESMLDMYSALEKLTLSKETISGLNASIQGKEVEIEALKQQMEPLKSDLLAKDDLLKSQIQEVDSYKQALQAKEGRIRAHESGNRAKDALIKAKDREIAAKKQDVIAKDSLLRASQKRIDFLEQQLITLRRGVEAPLSPGIQIPAPSQRKSRSNSPTHSPAAAPEPVKGDTHQVVFRKNKGRVQGRNIVSDGHAFQDAQLRRTKSMSSKEYDPVLANILARQHQRIEEAATAKEEKQDKEKSSPPPVRPKRPRASSLTSAEIRNIMESKSDQN